MLIIPKQSSISLLPRWICLAKAMRKCPFTEQMMPIFSSASHPLHRLGWPAFQIPSPGGVNRRIWTRVWVNIKMDVKWNEMKCNMDSASKSKTKQGTRGTHSLPFARCKLVTRCDGIASFGASHPILEYNVNPCLSISLDQHHHCLCLSWALDVETSIFLFSWTTTPHSHTTLLVASLSSRSGF